MKFIHAVDSTVEIGPIEKSSFQTIIGNEFKNSKKVLLCDENTYKYCVEKLVTFFDDLSTAEIIVIPIGEDSKSIELCIQIWSSLKDYHIGRGDLLINVGGGVVCDLGGFIASTYKRGIGFINIPTSLLAMVDASIGGKNGIDLAFTKNLIGTFNSPLVVFCDLQFLNTLPQAEIEYGKAEMFKHGLIAMKSHWQAISELGKNSVTENMLFDSISIKNEIICQDFKESDIRKKLNFGHTVGHAIEGWALKHNSSIPHGVCVAWGIITESLLSTKSGKLPQQDYLQIEKIIKKHFKKPIIKENDLNEIHQFMINDKKNVLSINFTGLTRIGEAEINLTYSDELIINALKEIFC